MSDLKRLLNNENVCKNVLTVASARKDWLEKTMAKISTTDTEVDFSIVQPPPEGLDKPFEWSSRDVTPRRIIFNDINPDRIGVQTIEDILKVPSMVRHPNVRVAQHLESELVDPKLTVEENITKVWELFQQTHSQKSKARTNIVMGDLLALVIRDHGTWMQRTHGVKSWEQWYYQNWGCVPTVTTTEVTDIDNTGGAVFRKKYVFDTVATVPYQWFVKLSDECKKHGTALIMESFYDTGLIANIKGVQFDSLGGVKIIPIEGSDVQ